MNTSSGPAPLRGLLDLEELKRSRWRAGAGSTQRPSGSWRNCPLAPNVFDWTSSDEHIDPVDNAEVLLSEDFVWATAVPNTSVPHHQDLVRPGGCKVEVVQYNDDAELILFAEPMR